MDLQQDINSVEKTIFPMQLIMFGNPQTGSMTLSGMPVVGLEISLKVLFWESNNKVVFVAYNNSDFFDGPV